jgi:hypothetical protein
MPACRIIEGTDFGPEVIRAACAAFEAAWSEIADRFDASTQETAREILATSIISAVRDDSSDPDVLRGAGLRAMERAYPERFRAEPPDDKRPMQKRPI